MNSKPAGVLQHKLINNWNLYFLIALPISLVMVTAILQTELSSGPAVSSMIQLSVRMAVPFIFLAFAASSLNFVLPSLFSRWLLRNRKIMGLCFATAMAWQGYFILWLVTIHRDYYVEEVYALSDAVEGVVGYSFLILMTLTSFKFARSRISPQNWKLLHNAGIYWLWAYAWSVYWWNLFYYHDIILLNYIYYWLGFFAWGLRMWAWSKKRWQQSASPSTA